MTRTRDWYIKTQQGLESEVSEGGDTSTNKPGNSIGTEVISPEEGGSDDNSDGPTGRH